MHVVRLPKADFHMEEGVIHAWHKEEGDRVEEGEVLFEFESEKVIQEVCAEQSGVLLRVVAQVGESVTLGTPVAIIGSTGEEIPPALEQTATVGKTEVVEKDDQAQRVKSSSRQEKSSGQLRISPLARSMAREHNIDLEAVRQSFTGKVIKPEDIEAFIAQRGQQGQEPGEAIPLTGIRKTMFERMSRVASTYASTTTVQKADVTELIELKQKLSQSWEQEAKPRYIAFFVKAAGAHPVGSD